MIVLYIPWVQFEIPPLRKPPHPRAVRHSQVSPPNVPGGGGAGASSLGMAHRRSAAAAAPRPNPKDGADTGRVSGVPGACTGAMTAPPAPASAPEDMTLKARCRARAAEEGASAGTPHPFGPPDAQRGARNAGGSTGGAGNAPPSSVPTPDASDNTKASLGEGAGLLGALPRRRRRRRHARRPTADRRPPLEQGPPWRDDAEGGDIAAHPCSRNSAAAARAARKAPARRTPTC